MAIDRLVIRPEQLHAMGLALHEEARLYFIDHCWNEFPELCESFGEAEVDRLVRAGMAKAASLGHDNFGDTLTIVELTVGFGEDFEEMEPWARPIWESSLPAQRKIGLLAAAATEERIRMIVEGSDA